MFCKNCGTVLPDFATECPCCHTVINENTAGQNQQYQSNYNNNYSYQNSNPGAQNYSQNNQYAPNGFGFPPPPPDFLFRKKVEETDSARIMAILGIILGIFVTPIIGWVLGGIALSNAKDAFTYTGSNEAKGAISLSKWSIGVATAIAIIWVIAILAFCAFSTAFFDAMS